VSNADLTQCRREDLWVDRSIDVIEFIGQFLGRPEDDLGVTHSANSFLTEKKVSPEGARKRRTRRQSLGLFERPRVLGKQMINICCVCVDDPTGELATRRLPKDISTDERVCETRRQIMADIAVVRHREGD
jgi:hypothetical protein